MAAKPLHSDPAVHHVLGGFLDRLEAAVKTTVRDLENVAATQGKTIAADAGSTLSGLANLGINSLIGGAAPGMGSFDFGKLAEDVGAAAGKVVGDVIR